jgi:hypothetical protein
MSCSHDQDKQVHLLAVINMQSEESKSMENQVDRMRGVYNSYVAAREKFTSEKRLFVAAGEITSTMQDETAQAAQAAQAKVTAEAKGAAAAGKPKSTDELCAEKAKLNKYILNHNKLIHGICDSDGTMNNDAEGTCVFRRNTGWSCDAFCAGIGWGNCVSSRFLGARGCKPWSQRSTGPCSRTDAMACECSNTTYKARM